MKCANCGNEFGNGAYCQSCGVDRVTGLGNYSGYNKPAGSYEPHYNSSSNGGYASNTTVCYACSEIVPSNSVYCPVCGRQLLVECPKCGSTYSSQYKICSKCGTNRDVYYKQKEAEKQRAIKEEQERERRQREWEQSPEGKAKLEQERKRKEDKESQFACLGNIIIFVGGTIFTFLLDSWIDKNFLNIDIFSINIRIGFLMCIGYGAAFLCANLLGEIMED